VVSVRSFRLISISRNVIPEVYSNGRLFFPRGSEVDGIWSTLARSVVDGPLKKAGVDLAKVASAPKSSGEGQVVSCLLCLAHYSPCIQYACT